jgi:trimeric autotransporter adhesin
VYIKTILQYTFLNPSIRKEKFMKNRFLFTLVALFGLAACSDDIMAPDTQVATDIVVLPAVAQLELGDTLRLVGQVIDQFGNVMPNVEVLWESSNRSIASVTTAGLVTANTRGQASITAISGALRASTTIFVVNESVANVVITATLPTGGLVVGNSIPATAIARSSKGNTITEYVTTWTSSAPTVATVSASGVITAVSEGSATITATIAGVSSTLQVVTKLVPTGSVVVVSPTTPTYVGRSVQMGRTLLSAGGDTLTASQRSLTWASSDTTVARVSNTGVLTGISTGTTRISLIVGSTGVAPVVGFLDVAVTQVPIADVEIVADTTSLVIGDRREYVARALDANDNVLTALELDGRTFSWAVSSAATTTPIIATPGVTVTHIRRWYTAVAEGIAEIVATITGVSATIEVEVVAPAP